MLAAAVVLLGVVLAGWLLWGPALRVGRQVRAQNSYERVESHSEAILAAAGEWKFEPELLAGLMYVESRGKIDAVSSKDALGLFQLMLPTAREWAGRLDLPEPSRADLLRDATLNARLAAAYLHWLDLRFDADLERMLIAYNAGPGRLKGWIADAGSYAAWREERERAGDSQVLAFVREVERHRLEFVRRGHFSSPE